MSCENFLKLTIKLFLVISLLLGVGFCFPKSIQAQEESINSLRIFYQGTLLDSEEKPVEDGNYNMRFSIYDAETEGNILWQEEYAFYNAVSIKNGQFKIILGRTKPINLKIEEGPFWLEVSIGNLTEDGEIIWNLGTEQRKKIMSLSDFLKEEGLDYLKEDGITEEEWEEIYQLLEKKLKEQPNLVFLLDLEQIKTNGNNSSFQLFDTLRIFINFISEKVLEIGDKISEIGGKIDEILKRIEEITLALFNIGEKVDRLYQVLVADKGLGPEELPLESSETKNYTSQKFERLTIKAGESSIRVFNESIKAESLIFVSFFDDPGSQWWISKKVPENSFTISLKEPAPQDLRFDYWILNPIRDEISNGAGEENQQPLFSSTTGQNQLPEEQPNQSEEPKQLEEPQVPEEIKEAEPIESTTTINNQTSSEEIQPVSPEEQNEEQFSEPSL